MNSGPVIRTYAAVALVSLTLSVAALAGYIAVFEPATHADFAAAANQTTTVAEPAPVYPVVITGALAGVVYMFSSLIVRIGDEEGDE